jgi:hypothetical protein
MKERLPTWLLQGAALLIPALVAHAQATDPLPPETQLVTASGAPAPTQETFTIATAQDLVATFTDLQIPAALSGASVVVTQGASIVGMAALAPPATTATVSLPGALGEYTLAVIGTPSTASNVGTFTVCVAPSATPTACISSASIAGNITVQTTPANPTLSTLTETLTVTTGGAYTFTYADDQFPTALSAAPSLALFQGSTVIAAPVAASPATITLNPGVYTLFAIAQANATSKAGLYGITISGPGVAPLLDSSFPVGTLSPASPGTNPSAQTLTLNVTDFAFPVPLASARAMVTAGGTILGTATAGSGASNFPAPAGSLQVWSFGTGAASGAFEVDLTSAAASISQVASALSNATSLVFAFITPSALTAGTTYQVSASDYQFPAALQGLQFAVAQGAMIQKSMSGAGAVTFTAAGAPAVLLVDATIPAANGNGMFDVNLQTTTATPQFVFDQTQGVSTTGVFTSQAVNIGTAGNFDATLSDLGFPAQFASLALLISNNGQNLGKIYGGGTSTYAATPGTYQLNFIATPGTLMSGAPAQYGLYAVQIVNSPPIVTLTASATTVLAGTSTTLSWTTTNAAACTGSGGAFTGNEATGSGNASVAVAATTTYTLTCTGPGGSSAQSVTVTVTGAPAKSSSGGGEISLDLLGLLGLLAALRIMRVPKNGEQR